jgi:hypothetical protein
MITVDDVRSFLNTAGADFSETEITNAINLAQERLKSLIGEEIDNANPRNRKAWILLTIVELASSVNLYWKGSERTELIRTKELIAEVESLLGLVPKGAVKWQTLTE